MIIMEQEVNITLDMPKIYTWDHSGLYSPEVTNHDNITLDIPKHIFGIILARLEA